MIELVLEATFLLFVRVSAFVAFLPLFGGTRVPRTVKVGLAVTLTVVWFSQFVPGMTLAMSQYGERSWLLFAWMIGREATLGAAMGWLMGMVFIPIRISGAFIAQEMGLTIATLTSASGDGSSNVLSEILDALAVLIFFSFDGHHLFFRIFDASFQLFPVGHQWASVSGEWVMRTIADTTGVGVNLAAPVVMLMFGTTVSLLFIMRQTPQFNLFNFGMPVRLLAGLLALFLFIPDLILRMPVLVERWLMQLS
ncbi:flagellar biosynthetic protein FliR [Thalassoglobus polymorphus]|uniref:Flagellar biosynthesis protein FliR n=1 Tax=Thalassoglobus polymorphus TaxID=2527994 RepID=A0A517QMF5_9PLAN|nr:flagellar biosynthetic protein FliR [Thalassoglobus polymorphus]QDT32822.1 flagellar biosynthesis protein FliR [Thalassoglobus polymorphus]